MEPLVCAVMLTKDRPDMAKRAVECFRGQTYERKRLIVLHDGSKKPYAMGVGIEAWIPTNEWSIGRLRNFANAAAANEGADILIHLDDDDWSHPNRIAEQVALLQASGKQAVGYRDMLFWRRCPELFLPDMAQCDEYEAWLYSNNDPRYCLGTSLCYWRAAWEKRPFQDISRGEDKAWLREVDSLGVSSLQNDYVRQSHLGVPRMIASIHSGNHVVYEPERSPHNWKRVPEWDAHCRKAMSL